MLPSTVNTQSGVKTGWGLAPAFIGRHVMGPGAMGPSAATGNAHGNAKVSLTTNDGFAPGSLVYPDIKNGPPPMPRQQEYIANWCNAVVAADFGVGVYCSQSLASDVHSLRSSCRIWESRVAATLASDPAAP